MPMGGKVVGFMSGSSMTIFASPEVASTRHTMPREESAMRRSPACGSRRIIPLGIPLSGRSVIFSTEAGPAVGEK